jgi:hypothetical protein
MVYSRQKRLNWTAIYREAKHHYSELVMPEDVFRHRLDARSNDSLHLCLDATGKFAVEIQSSNGRREEIGGFETEQKAEQWMIDRQGTDDAGSKPVPDPS